MKAESSMVSVIPRSKLSAEKVIRGKRRKATVMMIFSVLIFLILWQIIGSQLNPILMSTPSAVGSSFVQLLMHQNLVGAFLFSLRDMFIGLGAAIVIGIAVGILMGRYEMVDRIVFPYTAFMNSTPTVAILPLMIIWFGLGLKARVVFIFLITVWTIIMNTNAGIKNLPKGLMEVGLSLNLNEPEIVRHINIPFAMSYIMAGLRVAAGRAIIGMIIGEMEIKPAGLGGLLTILGDDFKTSGILAVVIVTSLVGVLFVAIINFIEHRWFPWVAATAGQHH